MKLSLSLCRLSSSSGLTLRSVRSVRSVRGCGAGGVSIRFALSATAGCLHNTVLSRFYSKGSSCSSSSSSSSSDGSRDSSAKPEDAATYTKFKSSFMTEMQERGYIQQCSDFQDLDEKFFNSSSSGSTMACYLGFDATASSLHVGSLLQIMVLRLLQKHGHKPYVLIGGGTTKVGDPSGKDEARQLLTNETIQRNAQSLSMVFSKYIKFGDGSTDAVMVNNANWLESLNYLDFLRDFGVHFSVNRMLSFESVKQRLAREQPLSFLEFNYMLLQAYDFYELNNRFNVAVQIGGSDQWGNIIGGVDLIRRVKRQQTYALTTPLITTSDGKKMGKSVSGAIWLDKTLLSEFEYWQFWRNCTDADLPRFLRLYTELPISKIREMDTWKDGDLNKAKVVLADEITRLLHGEQCLEIIHATAKSLFTGGTSVTGSDLSNSCLPKYVLDQETSQKLLQITTTSGEAAAAEVKDKDTNTDKSDSGVVILDILVRCAMAPTRNEGRRMIASGCVRINDVKIDDEYYMVSRKNFNDEKFLKLSSSKKKHMLVYLS